MESQRKPGQRVGAHELVRLLGAGGMGEVWEAVLHGPAGFQKVVALKLLHATPSAVDRAMLVREARLGARLQHPNVVSVLGLGEADGNWYVVMELVRGRSASQLVRADELSPSLVLDIGVQAASGLAHIHGLRVDDRPAGLVHCDIKPENLLVDEYGIVKVADLGIAALAGDRSATGGTPGYMAPEQLDGQPEARSDVFGLGATLYVLATRTRPFERTLRGLFELERQLDQPTFVAPLDARIPGLGEVVRRCLRAEPADRFATALELGAALARLRSAVPVPVGDVATVLRTPAPSEAEALTSAPSVAPPPARDSARSTTGNVVRPHDRFVGREAELGAVLATLRGGERLVSLLAMGGTGKTRLATEVALALGSDLAGGAWMLELASARGREELCGAVAGQLGVPLQPGDPAVQVGNVLAARGAALFVLDNLEQCIDAVRTLLPAWMAAAPRAQFLVTSRIALKLKGERSVALGVLTPDDAAALFHDRAPVSVPAHHADELRALCAELDHVPLAIELAAARLRVLSVVQMRQRLGLKLLSGGSTDLPDRHRSLEASIRWSWDLLSPTTRTALTQLSVFVGGCSLAAAEAVLDEAALGPGGWAIDVVTELSDASLVRVEPESDRLQLLAVVRTFAAAQGSAADREATAARHAAFFAQLGAPGALERLHVPAVLPDLDNLVAATRHVIGRPEPALVTPLLLATTAVLDRVGPHELATELCTAALRVGGVPDADRARMALSAARGALVMGRAADADGLLALAEDAVERSGDPLLIGVLRSTVAIRFRLAGRPDEAERAYAEAMARLEPIAPPHVLARVVSSRGGLYTEQGRDEEARAWFERSLRLRRTAGDRHGEAMDRANLGNVAMALGRHAEALAHQHAALALYHEVGDQRGVSQITGDLGLSLQHLHRETEAEGYYRAALALHRRAGNRRFEGIVASNLGMMLTELGRLDEAEHHLAAALELHRGIGNRRSEGIALQALAKLEERSGRLARAEGLVRDAIAVHVAVRNRRWEATGHELHARLLEALGRADEADEALEKAALGFAALGSVDRVQAVVEHRVRLGASKTGRR